MASGAEALGGIVGGLLGKNAASMDRSHAKEQAKAALQYWNELGKAPDTSLPIILKELEAAGMLTPELQEELSMQASEFENIKEDPALRETQLEALNKFKQSAETGMGADERAAQNQIRQSNNQNTSSKQAQILDEYKRRGISGGGNELIAQLSAAQAGADNASKEGDNLMSLIAQRMRQGTQDMANSAQQLAQQDYNKAANRATALDERNKYLNQNSVARQAANVTAQNAAQDRNLVNAQRIADTNKANANAELQRQQLAKSDNYNQNLAMTSGKAGQSNTLSNFFANQGNAKAQSQVAMGQGVGQVADAGAEMIMSDKKFKENVNYDNESEVESFLDNLKPVSYDYKDEVKGSPMASEKRQVGVMAQDLEKSEAGRNAVVNTDQGKLVDYKELQPKILAALGHINKRLNKMEGK